MILNWATQDPPEQRNISTLLETFSVNYNSNPNVGCNPSFSTSSETKQAAQHNNNITGQSANAAHMYEAVFVGAPKYYEVALKNLRESGVDISTEIEKMKK
jgi:hypothetical protein